MLSEADIVRYHAEHVCILHGGSGEGSVNTLQSKKRPLKTSPQDNKTCVFFIFTTSENDAETSIDIISFIFNVNMAA